MRMSPEVLLMKIVPHLKAGQAEAQGGTKKSVPNITIRDLVLNQKLHSGEDLTAPFLQNANSEIITNALDVPSGKLRHDASVNFLHTVSRFHLRLFPLRRRLHFL